MVTTRSFATAVAVALLLLDAAPARAHAFLDHSDPAVGSTVPTAPPVIGLWFTQELEPAFSSVTVTNQAGASVNAAPAAIAADNKAKLVVQLKPLPPGTYKVKWRVLSVDTHTTKGDFTFTVGG